MDRAWLAEGIEGASGACPSPHISLASSRILPRAPSLAPAPSIQPQNHPGHRAEFRGEWKARGRERENREQKAGERACGQQGRTWRMG